MHVLTHEIETHHLPYLQYVVLGDASNDPMIIEIPTEVRNLGCVSSVDEEQLGRSVFCILWLLFVPNATHVPDVQASV